LVDEREAPLTKLRALPGIIGIEAHLTERDALESDLESAIPPKTATALAGG
jgi:hypothetical protein